MKKDSGTKLAKLSKDEEQDADIATAMAESVLNSPEAKQAIDKMLDSAEPVMALGQVVANAILQMKSAADKKGLELSSNIWMAKGGVADRLAESLARDTDARRGGDVMGNEQKIWIETLNVLKLAAQSGAQQAQQPQQQPQTGGYPAVEYDMEVPAGPFGGRR